MNDETRELVIKKIHEYPKERQLNLLKALEIIDYEERKNDIHEQTT